MSLICASCGYDNDPTRVYCHNCGVRLDREGAVAPPPTGFTQPGTVLKRPRGPSLPWRSLFMAALRALMLVALVVMAVLAFLPPRDVPAPVMPDPGLADRLSSLVSDSAAASGARAFSVPAGDAAVWLATNVHLQPASDGFVLLRPERLYAVPGQGVLRVGLVARLPMDLPVYFEGDFAPVRGAQGYTLEARRLAVGRLVLPRVLDLLVRRHFSGLGAAVELPLADLARCDQIGVSPQAINLRWGGTAP